MRVRKGGLAHPDSYREARELNFLILLNYGGLAQLARACDWQSQGREFDSPNLHSDKKAIMNFSLLPFYFKHVIEFTKMVPGSFFFLN